MHLIPSRGLPGIAVDRQCITLNNVPSPLLNLYPGKFGAGTLKKTRSFPVNVCSATGCSRLWTRLHSRTCPPSPRRGQCTRKNKRVHPLRNKDSWKARWVGELEQGDQGPGRISILSPAGGPGRSAAAWWACQVRNKPLTQGLAQAHK